MVRAPPPVLGVDARGRSVRAAPQSATALRGGESSDGSSGHELHPGPRAGTPVRALARERSRLLRSGPGHPGHREAGPGHALPVTGSDQASGRLPDRKSTRLNSSHLVISYAVFCLKKKTKTKTHPDALHKIKLN